MNRAHQLLLTTALAATTFGCGNIVTTAGSNGTDDVPGGENQIGVGGNGSSTSTGSGTTPPLQSDNVAQINGDVVEVELANYAQTCGQDNFPVCTIAETWQVRLKIPVAKLVAGTVISLADAQGFNSGSFAEDPAYPQSCGGGGGTYWDGNVEVVAVSDTQATLRLTGTGGLITSGTNADGDYDVLLCGQKPPPAHLLTSAVATPSYVTPGNLTLYATSLQNTCADPSLGALGCSVGVDGVSIELSPAMQAVGTYPLDQIGTFSSWHPDPQASCGGGGGSYFQGTIEIVSIDASQVVFTLAGTSDGFFFSKGNADGTFTAPRCN